MKQIQHLVDFNVHHVSIIVNSYILVLPVFFFSSKKKVVSFDGLMLVHTFAEFRFRKSQPLKQQWERTDTMEISNYSDWKMLIAHVALNGTKQSKQVSLNP